MKRTMLYFGSFNPVHRGHIALAEHVLRKGLCDNVVLVVSPQNPMKQESTLLPELTRFEMAEIACRESAFPDAIMPSAVEFLLDKPSYTINTLRFLQQNNGSEMRFSILMGADNIEKFHLWREADAILADYEIYVYPRKGCDGGELLQKVHYLADAPLFDCSSTDIRNALAHGRDVSAMLPAGVLDYIRRNGLFPQTADRKAEGVEHYRRNEWGAALNAFRAAVRENPDDAESQEYIKMIEEILAFRYKDIYNP